MWISTTHRNLSPSSTWIASVICWRETLLDVSLRFISVCLKISYILPTAIIQPQDYLTPGSFVSATPPQCFPEDSRLLLCSGTSPRLRTKPTSTLSRTTLKISTWSQLASREATRALWATKYSRGKSCRPAKTNSTLSTFTSLYSLRKRREMNKY